MRAPNLSPDISDKSVEEYFAEPQCPTSVPKEAFDNHVPSLHRGYQ